MPQQPIHPCQLPHSSRFNTLSLHCNPYECRIGSRTFLGHSGQPVTDILLQTTSESNGTFDEKNRNLSVLHRTLKWSHLAPTAPDTTPCFSFSKVDPFVINLAPD